MDAVHAVGNTISLDILGKVALGEIEGQGPRDFGLETGVQLSDDIATAWGDARSFWESFQRSLNRLPENDPGTGITRSQWIVPLLRSLGHGKITYRRQAAVAGGGTFAISHWAGVPEESPPIHIEGCRTDLDRRRPGITRFSPHALVQEYLNRTEHVWGIVTNGYRFRLLRDNFIMSRPSYLEFDLQQIMEEEKYSDFALFYRIVHRSRLPKGLDDASECLLEKYYQLALAQGGRVREHLRDGVERALTAFGTGFLRHPKSETLREKVAEGKLSAEEFYEQLLHLIYRFLFLMVSEERNLVEPEDDRLQEIYRRFYSISRLRDLAESFLPKGERHLDLWEGLRVTFRLFEDDEAAKKFGMTALDGALFSPDSIKDLNDAFISNTDLLQAMRYLSLYEENGMKRRVNYAALDVEELGSVYESLLDYRSLIVGEGSHLRFAFAPGSKRKSTGSYYTRPELVQELVKSALAPVIEEKLKGAQTKEEKERALLSIKVIDPASGSGHFLLAASRRIGQELAKVRTGEEQPGAKEYRKAVRDVIRHCIYGVDKNPLAVDLCKVALWLEGHSKGEPLTFLDHRIKCGDSLVGVFDLDVLEKGIPDDAYKPVSGDDKKFARELKQRNKQEREGQLSLFGKAPLEMKDLAKSFLALDRLDERTAEDVRIKSELYQEWHGPGTDWWTLWTACNLWTAAFFVPITKGKTEHIPTTDNVRSYLSVHSAADAQMVGKATAIAQERRFFHWPLEFPDVFTQGGFDVVLSNPPWERIKLQEKEFFATRDLEIANAPNAAERKRLIRRLPQSDPDLWHEYQQALHTAEATSRFLRGSGRYPLTGRGDINTYSVFAELGRDLLCSEGRAGILVPTGIATDDTNKLFFADLVERGQLVSLFDFENREALFPGVHRSYKFSLLTLRGVNGDQRPPTRSAMNFVFFATRVDQLRDPWRRFSLTPEDIARINPNTRTLPVFRTRQDAELTRYIYERVPVLVNERTGENPWGVRFLRMFDMSNDSHLFRTRAELEAEGYELLGNRFVGWDEVWLPLYEAKMIWHYDHRYGTYEGVTSRSNTHLPTLGPEEHADPSYFAQPWYWVPEWEVQDRTSESEHGWWIGFRDVTNATNERTAVFSLIPWAGVGNKVPIWFFNKPSSAASIVCLLASVCSLPLDYVARQKLGGMTMNFFYVKQFPVLAPTAYTEDNLLFIVPRVLELVYTAWDVTAFATEVLSNASGELSDAIWQQWEANRDATGGNFWGTFPEEEWWEAYPDIVQSREMTPFKWDEERRARIRAELDAYYARLYGLTRKQLRYILDPADLTKKELEDILDPWEEVDAPLDPESYERRVAKSDFPGETFRVLKEKEIKKYGEYRTRRLVLEAWEELSNKKL